jgi:ribonuclease D
MQYVTTEEQYHRTLGEIEPATMLAVDTEAAGYHRYADSVCLLQLSTRDRTWVIDALAVDLGLMKQTFADAKHEIVIHDAEYDLRLLSRDYDIHVARLFDTKLAAQLLGEPSIGLASLIGKYLGIRLDKKHQRADWAQRPLPVELLEYAASDTRHLLELRDRLAEALRNAGRLHWAEEEFDLRNSPSFAPEDPDAYLRIKNIRDLVPRQLAVLREIHAWRDRLARDRDVAPFRILSSEVMVAVARRMPHSPADLNGTSGVDAAGQRHARELVEAVERARQLPDDALPVRPRPPRRPPVDREFEALIDRLKSARDRQADELGLDRGFLMPRQQLEEIAAAQPATPGQLREMSGVRNWQVEALGEQILHALR